MDDGEMVERLVLLTISYTKQALSKVYPETGTIDFAKIRRHPVYATSKGIEHFVFMDCKLVLAVSRETKSFRSKAQFTLNGDEVKPQLLELKFTVSNSTQQFYFREENENGQPVYRMWESNHINM